MMASRDVDFPSPVYLPKSFVWTMKNKYPRTTHNNDYCDWSKNPLRDGTNMYVSPQRPVYPLPPTKQFRPLPPELTADRRSAHQDARASRKEFRTNNSSSLFTGEAMKMRLTEVTRPVGRKTPADAFHYGHRIFSLDPTKKALRKYDDPIFHPLDTVARADFTSPSDRPHLLYDNTKERNRPREAAVGIVPGVMSWGMQPPTDGNRNNGKEQTNGRHNTSPQQYQHIQYKFV